MPRKPTAFRGLTPGEIALARAVFGASVDYNQVRITDGKFLPFQPRGTAMAPNGNLYMYGCYCADFAAGDLWQQAHFIHEMAHVWQYQNRILHPVHAAIALNLQHAFNYRAAYDYTLAPGRDLLSYNMEQQAAILQDDFILRRGGDGAGHRGHCRNTGLDDAACLNLMRDTLAAFRANPSYARRAQFPPIGRGR